MNDEDDILTPEDLARVFFRAPDAQGHWGNVSAAEATDAQFDTWAREKMWVDPKDDDEWPAEERLAFCHMLYANDELIVLRKTAPSE